MQKMQSGEKQALVQLCVVSLLNVSHGMVRVGVGGRWMQRPCFTSSKIRQKLIDFPDKPNPPLPFPPPPNTDGWLDAHT